MFRKITAAATAFMFLVTIGCGDDKPRAKQPWASAPAAEDVTTHAAAGISSKDFALDLVHAKIAAGVKDPGELQQWIGETEAVSFVDINPKNDAYDAIMVSMEAIGTSQCFVFGAVEESTVDTPFNVGRVCVSETETGEVAIQSTYPEHVQGYQDHSYRSHYPRSHFMTGMFAGALLGAFLMPSYHYGPRFGVGYWGAGGGYMHRPVVSVSQRTTIRTTHRTTTKVVTPKAKPRPANVTKSKAAKRTASKFANKGGAKAGRPGDKKMGSRAGQGTKFSKGSTKPVKSNNSFLSNSSKNKAAAGGKTRAPMPAKASVTNRRASGSLPAKGQAPTAKQGGRSKPSTSRPASRPSSRSKPSRSKPSRSKPSRSSRPSSKHRRG